MVKSEYFLHSELSPRETMMPGHHYVIHQTLVKEKIISLPLHIKLCLMKQFTKAVKQIKSCFQYLKAIFHKKSDASINEDIFVSPQIRQLLDNKNFEATMSEI